MAATSNLSLTLPTVGADSGAWGGELNADLTAIDALWVNIGDVAFGTAATKNIGTSGAAVPLLNGTNTWAATQTFANGLGSSSDITVNRAAAPTTGAVFFGNTGVHYLFFDGTDFLVGGSGFFGAPAGGFSGNLAGNVTGNVIGNAATATALTSGDKTISGNLTVTGQVVSANDANFNMRKAGSVYVLQMGTTAGINYDPTTGRLTIVAGGIPVGYFDSTGYTQVV